MTARQYRILPFGPTGIDMIVERVLFAHESDREALEAVARRFASNVGGDVVAREVVLCGPMYERRRLDFTVSVLGKLSYFTTFAKGAEVHGADAFDAPSDLDAVPHGC